MLSRRKLLLGLILAGVVVVPTIVLAQATTFSVESVGSQVGLGGADLRQTIINVIRWVLGFITLVAVGYLIYGGVLWMTSRGDAKQIEKAKRVILQALIGLVIILLAWAIVFFVARQFSRVTTNRNNTNTVNPNCGPFGCVGAQSDFNVIGVTSCAARPEYDENVPRSSNIAVTFNSRVQPPVVQTAIVDATAAPNLAVEKCTDPPNCTTWSTAPHPINGQVFTEGGKPTGVANATRAEWVLNRNTLTFYHRSFSDDQADHANNRWFEAGQTYRVTIPKDTAATALKDLRDRVLKRCEQAPLMPIEGGGCDDTHPDYMTWTFQVGNDTAGPALNVQRTVPTSAYRSGSGSPDRNVNRTPNFVIEYNNAIDPNSFTTDTFQVFKLNAAPDLTNRASWQVNATPVDASTFDWDYLPSGAAIATNPAKPLEAFTWYLAVVKDVRNLCSTLQQDNPYEWVFQTNDAVPGVKLVYPKNGNDRACPATEVFIQFATPMWKPGSFDCQAGAPGSYVRTGTLSPDPGRVFGIVNNYDPADPNRSCTKYAFEPTTTLLAANTNYTASVTTDLQTDQAGTRLSKTWSFRTKTTEACVQEPYIERVSPQTGSAGACISVIGNYFEKKLLGSATRETDGKNPGDKLTLRAADQPVKSWQNKVIVSSPLDAAGLTVNQAHKYKVTVAYPDEALQSNEESFFLESGTGGGGPCLLSLNPDSGRVGIGVDATGENLGSGGGSSAVPYVNGITTNWDISRANWSPTAIEGINVTPASPVGNGQVHVIRNDGIQSNELPFEVTTPSTGQTTPRVVEDTQCDPGTNTIPSPNPKRGDTQACTNGQITARFTLPMDGPSIETAGAVTLEKCDPACTPVAASVAFLPDRALAVTPLANLAGGKPYKVTISTNVKSQDPPQVPLAAPYTWTFTTATGANCQIQNISCSSGAIPGSTPVRATPSAYTFRTTPYGVGLNALALGPECRTVNNASVHFSWSMNPDPNAVIAIDATTTGSANVALNVDPPSPGTAGVKATAQSKSCKEVSVTYDPTICTQNSDCDTNRFGEACGPPGSSTCEAGHCTPVVIDAVPKTGPVGEWTTIKGCWFGGFDITKSRVIFRGDVNDPSDDHDGRAPDALVCGSPAATWTNERIVREVPNQPTLQTTDDARTGPIRVNRADDTFADGPAFTVNTDPLTPGICKIAPSQGKPAANTTISGARFSATQDQGDEVTLQKMGSPTVNQMTVLGTSWSDTSISTQVPLAAEIGPSDVQVKNDGKSSNPWPFTVRDPSSASSAACDTKICASDAACTGTVNGVALNPTDDGCARDHCCRPRPQLISGTPSGTGVCRNTLATATFDQPLDSSSATPDTVWYLDGARLANGNISVRNIDDPGTGTKRGTIEYGPGSLQPNTRQELHLITRADAAFPLVKNPSFETANGTVPADWITTAGASQSNEHAAGAGKFSGLANCAACTSAAAQEFLVQDVANTNVAGKTFRITGWVKAEIAAGSKGGLVTQCAAGGAAVFNGCGYDLAGGNPGQFTAASSGWKQVDYQVTQNNGFTNQLRLTCFANQKSRVWCDDVSITEVTTSPTAIRGANGVLANVTTSPGRSPIAFTTGPDICRISRVVVTPSDLTFSRFTSLNQAEPFYAWAEGPKGELLFNIPNVYSWRWNWASRDDKIVTASAVPQVTTLGNATITSKANGTTTVAATATVTQDASGGGVPRDFVGERQVSVDVCDKPWQIGAATGFNDSNNNCTAGGACTDYHFSLYYCRGQNGQTLLPNFGYTAVEGDRADGAGRRKSFFFKESSSSRDTIGMLIYANDQFLSPADWYRDRFPLDTGASSTSIAGYPAVRTGTTAYIGVTDLEGGATRALIFVVDFNSNNADANTKNIYNRILAALEFNTNITSPAIKQQLVNDTKRRQDLTSIKRLLEGYHEANSKYPDLAGGTYLLGMSTSVWPSWQQTLGNALGKTLPSDPTNGFNPACEAPTVPANQGYDKKTCWSEPQRKFQCPSNSRMYAYRLNGGAIGLYANMEYLGTGSFANRDPNTNLCGDLNASTCTCFNYQLP